MEWWMWLAGGVVLLVIELSTPSGFFVMFFGLGAMAVGILSLFGLTGAAWMEWLLFTALSLVFVLLFRGRLQHRVQLPESSDVDSLVGELATPRERIPPNAVGRVELRGTTWSARNDSPAVIDTGQRCRVTRVDGLLVFVKPE
jgi:membrane protein implicated in regulation of membrane protease activity